ncbi:MAG: RNA polymerase sigma factor [Cyclobacteriaceae bacterium]
MNEDEDLILRCRKDDRKAQNLLFNIYEKKVLAVVIRYTSSIDEAKDIQQEAFIKVFNNLKSNVTAILSLEKWIIRIAVNTAIDYFRKQKRIENLNDQFLFPVAEQPVVLEQLKEEELITLIQQMPDPYRLIFNLYIVEGYNHKEIAMMVNIEESTSRSYLTRAKDFLKSKLTQPENKKGYG